MRGQVAPSSWRRWRSGCHKSPWKSRKNVPPAQWIQGAVRIAGRGSCGAVAPPTTIGAPVRCADAGDACEEQCAIRGSVSAVADARATRLGAKTSSARPARHRWADSTSAGRTRGRQCGSRARLKDSGASKTLGYANTRKSDVAATRDESTVVSGLPAFSGQRPPGRRGSTSASSRGTADGRGQVSQVGRTSARDRRRCSPPDRLRPAPRRRAAPPRRRRIVSVDVEASRRRRARERASRRESHTDAAGASNVSCQAATVVALGDHRLRSVDSLSMVRLDAVRRSARAAGDEALFVVDGRRRRPARR
jgi:hypothetical protein